MFQCVIGYGIDRNIRFFVSMSYLCFSDYSIKDKKSESTRVSAYIYYIHNKYNT